MINLFNTGALIWIPSQTRRWVNDKEQLQIFPNMLSVKESTNAWYLQGLYMVLRM